MKRELETSSPETRIVVGSRQPEILAVQCARLSVIRGPDSGRSLDLGERPSATIGTHPDADLVLTDDSVSKLHAEIRAEPEGFVLRDLGSTNGTRVGDVLVREVVLTGKAPVLSLGGTLLKLTLSRDEFQRELSPRSSFGEVLGGSPAMRQLFSQLERVAATRSTVLLEGPSGSGKEVLAAALHAASPWAAGPYVVVDCGAIPSAMFESELFGHRKGAFTGAVADRDGLIAEASGGTLFLDEISDLPLSLQPKLLRVLEQREVVPIGEVRPRPVDIRVIAASQHNLQRRVDRGVFRSDLYFRLAVVKLAVPPLRHRAQDVPVLARHFVQQLRPDLDPDLVLTPELLAALSNYTWPGNVRELRNVVERLLAVGQLATGLRAGGRAPLGAYAHARRVAIDYFEREYCTELMHAAGGVPGEAARRAGLSRQMLHRLLAKHGVDIDDT